MFFYPISPRHEILNNFLVTNSSAELTDVSKKSVSVIKPRNRWLRRQHKLIKKDLTPVLKFFHLQGISQFAEADENVGGNLPTADV